LDTDQIPNEAVRLGQTDGSSVIGSQLYSSMLPNQQNGIEKLLNELRKKEPFVEFSVAEVKVKEMVSEGVKRTEAITVVVQSYPGGQIGDGSMNDKEVGKPKSETVVQANDSRDDPPAKTEIDVSAEVEAKVEIDDLWGSFAAKKSKKKNKPFTISHPKDPTVQYLEVSKSVDADKEKSQAPVVASFKVIEVEDEENDDFFGWGSSRKKSKVWDKLGTRGEIQLLDPKTKSLHGCGKVNYDAWWDWITPNDTNTQPQQHFLECWIYSDTDEAAYSIRDMKDHAVSHSIRQAPPTHNGLEPTGGLRLFHCKAENDEPPFAAADFKQ
ncbi:hypothetical protein V8E51_019206, partial [Hyaloscypha variabilis]